ncbi:MAG: hypothetical protein LBR67_03660 [Dysgonamonadaceae bacterium]|jgi:chitinase|nr:hypothetical protein [Dysgonamonadaceae bacterium]
MRRIIIFSVSLSLLLSSCGTKKTGITVTAVRPITVGYWPSWKSDFSPQWDKITHLNIAFGTVKADGTLNASALDRFKEAISQAHDHDVKVLLSVGGGASKYFTDALLDEEKRTGLVTALMQSVRDYRLDGIDLDYEEWTGGPGGMDQTDIPKRDALELLYKALRDSLGTGKLLTAAVSGSYDHGGWGFYNCYNNSMLEYLDYVCIMIYDMTGPWSGTNVGLHSSWSFFEKAIYHWLNNRKLPREKLVAGVPFYGYRFLSSNDAKGAKSIAFKDIVSETSGTDTYKKDSFDLTFYDGVETMARKAKYVKEKGLGGIMIWELSHDTDDPDKSLLNVIFENLK